MTCFIGAAEPDHAPPAAHWSFVPPTRPVIPTVTDPAWARNPIDAFVAAERRKRGLTPLPPAAKDVLLRRVYLDLIGIPPTRQELHDFLNDASPDAYEKVVDRLLASPSYGQRWGRHWMDIWRYSDWSGYQMEVRDSQPNIWRWRDWIIESLNGDEPYDQMAREMIAADEIAPEDDRALAATGFLARNYYKFSRNVCLDRIVEHTSKAFLGLTLNCARCHDHKYDPISQKEYYQFRAIFEPFELRSHRVAGASADPKNPAELIRVYDAESTRPTYLFIRGDDKNPDSAPLPPGVPGVVGGTLNPTVVSLPVTAWYPGMRPIAEQDSIAAAESEIAKAQAELGKAQTALAAARHQAESVAVAATTQPATVQPATAPTPQLASAVIGDDFSRPRPDIWQVGDGQWDFKNGRLLQTMTGAMERRLVSLAPHPRDFSARFTFRITGGDRWKSVGLSFDHEDADHAVSVYLSACSDDAKAQVALKSGSVPIFPAEARVAMPIELGHDYELRADVQGTLVNVYVNGAMKLAYRLPQARRSGRLSIWAFDASAEFASVRVEPLANDVKLQGQSTPATAGKVEPAVDPRKSVAVTEQAFDRATLHLLTVQAKRSAIEAGIAADRARFASPPASEAESLMVAAGRLQRQAAFFDARESLLSAEQAAATASASGNEKEAVEKQKSVAERQKAVEAARALIDVQTRSYSPIGKEYSKTSTGRRAALAGWLTDRANPLTARVAINHIWMRHFGEPIVPTVFDFGKNGKPPTDQPLLDWLAVEFMESGWRMKAMHRLIVTSATYRMASSPPVDEKDPAPAAAFAQDEKIDRDNRYLWRQNTRRMEAEAVRDSVLLVAGQLDLTAGGPELDEYSALTSPRRSLYFRQAPEKQVLFLEIFDGASPNECYRRNQTVQPQQALAMSNSPLALANARLLATDLGKSNPDEGAFITAAFEQVLCRPPTEHEREACARFLADQADRLKQTATLQRFGAGEKVAVAPANDPKQRAREDLIHVLLNDDDFVTIR